MRKKYLEFEPDDNGCFIVTSHRANQDGYSNLYRNKKHIRAHRLVFEECFGTIPEGLVIRHKCDNPRCINPEHLELGTNKENMRDAVERDRNAKGEKNGRSKLTEEKVREIRNMVSTGMQTKEIAKTLNISFETTKKVRERKTWKHVI